MIVNFIIWIFSDIIPGLIFIILDTWSVIWTELYFHFLTHYFIIQAMITLIMFVIKFPFQPLDIITAFLIAIVEEGYWAIVYHLVGIVSLTLEILAFIGTFFLHVRFYIYTHIEVPYNIVIPKWFDIQVFFNYILNSSAFFYIKSVDYQGIFDTINNLFPSGYINLNIYWITKLYNDWTTPIDYYIVVSAALLRFHDAYVYASWHVACLKYNVANWSSCFDYENGRMIIVNDIIFYIETKFGDAWFFFFFFFLFIFLFIVLSMIATYELGGECRYSLAYNLINFLIFTYTVPVYMVMIAKIFGFEFARFRMGYMFDCFDRSSSGLDFLFVSPRFFFFWLVMSSFHFFYYYFKRNNLLTNFYVIIYISLHGAAVIYGWDLWCLSFHYSYLLDAIDDVYISLLEQFFDISEWTWEYEIPLLIISFSFHYYFARLLYLKLKDDQIWRRMFTAYRYFWWDLVFQKSELWFNKIFPDEGEYQDIKTSFLESRALHRASLKHTELLGKAFTWYIREPYFYDDLYASLCESSYSETYLIIEEYLKRYAKPGVYYDIDAHTKEYLKCRFVDVHLNEPDYLFFQGLFRALKEPLFYQLALIDHYTIFGLGPETEILGIAKYVRVRQLRLPKKFLRNTWTISTNPSLRTTVVTIFNGENIHAVEFTNYNFYKNLMFVYIMKFLQGNWKESDFLKEMLFFRCGIFGYFNYATGWSSIFLNRVEDNAMDNISHNYSYLWHAWETWDPFWFPERLHCYNDVSGSVFKDLESDYVILSPEVFNHSTHNSRSLILYEFEDPVIEVPIEPYTTNFGRDNSTNSDLKNLPHHFTKSYVGPTYDLLMYSKFYSDGSWTLLNSPIRKVKMKDIFFLFEDRSNELIDLLYQYDNYVYWKYKNDMARQFSVEAGNLKDVDVRAKIAERSIKYYFDNSEHYSNYYKVQDFRKNTVKRDGKYVLALNERIRSGSSDVLAPSYQFLPDTVVSKIKIVNRLEQYISVRENVIIRCKKILQENLSFVNISINSLNSKVIFHIDSSDINGTSVELLDADRVYRFLSMQTFFFSEKFDVIFNNNENRMTNSNAFLYSLELTELLDKFSLLVCHLNYIELTLKLRSGFGDGEYVEFLDEEEHLRLDEIENDKVLRFEYERYLKLKSEGRSDKTDQEIDNTEGANKYYTGKVGEE